MMQPKPEKIRCRGDGGKVLVAAHDEAICQLFLPSRSVEGPGCVCAANPVGLREHDMM